MEYKKISELTTVVTGGTPSTSNAEYWNYGDIPWLQSGCCQNCDVDSAEKYITQLGYDNSSTKMMPPNTVMIALTGATAGKVGYLNINACGNQSITGILPSENLNQRYLFYYLMFKRPQILADCIGGAQPHISQGYVKNILIPVLPMEKQKEIALAFSKLDNLLNSRNQQVEKLDQLVKSRFIELFGDPKYNKSNLVRIGEIGALTSGGTPSRAKPEYFEGDIRWYSAGELNSLYLPDSVEHISERALQQSSAKLFNKGTLMIGMYDTAAFKMGILTEDSSSNQACANLNPKQGYNIVWLYYLFDIMKPIFLQERQGVRQKNLSLSKIKEFEVPFAPFELQEQFATFVEQTDKSKFDIQQSIDKLETLKKSLMQQYFG